MTFEEAADRSAAEALRGVELRAHVSVDERPGDPEEFYDHQLVGLRADDERGNSWGEVTDVLHLPAQDVLVVRHHDRDVLVPFVRGMVPTVDLARGHVVIVDEVGLFAEDFDAGARPLGGD